MKHLQHLLAASGSSLGSQMWGVSSIPETSPTWTSIAAQFPICRRKQEGGSWSSFPAAKHSPGGLKCNTESCKSKPPYSTKEVAKPELPALLFCCHVSCSMTQRRNWSKRLQLCDYLESSVTALTPPFYFYFIYFVLLGRVEEVVSLTMADSCNIPHSKQMMHQ